MKLRVLNTGDKFKFPGEPITRILDWIVSCDNPDMMRAYYRTITDDDVPWNWVRHMRIVPRELVVEVIMRVPE